MAGGNWWEALWEGFLGGTAAARGSDPVLPLHPSGCPQGGWLSWSPIPPTSTQGTSGEGRSEKRGPLGAVRSGSRRLIKPLGHFLPGPDLCPETQPTLRPLPAAWALQGGRRGRGRPGAVSPGARPEQTPCGCLPGHTRSEVASLSLSVLISDGTFLNGPG